jgi:hypothetical protein
MFFASRKSQTCRKTGTENYGSYRRQPDCLEKGSSAIFLGKQN